MELKLLLKILFLFFLTLSLFVIPYVLAETAQDWQYYKGEGDDPLWMKQIDKDHIQQLPPSRLGAAVLSGTFPTATPTPE